MEVKINREIRNYTEAMFFGLSMRQFFFFGRSAGSGRAAVLSPEALCRNGDGQLDVHSGCCPLCSAGLHHLPRHDGRAVPLGMAALRAAGAERAEIRIREHLLRGAEGRHRKP